MKFRHRTLIVIAGLVWFVIGIFLLTLGMRFIMETVREPAFLSQSGSFSLLRLMSGIFHNQQNGVVLLLTCALLLGFIKGRFVLSKTAQKQVNRILNLPDPAKITLLYTKSYYILIISMIGLGMGLRFLPITPDTRGAIDMAIGAALMNGAMLYFRSAVNYKYLKS